MAHYKRKRARSRPAGRGRGWSEASIRARLGKGVSWNWISSWPAWHDLVFNTRPKRRLNRALERAVLMDRVDADDCPWPLGSCKPHRYYW